MSGSFFYEVETLKDHPNLAVEADRIPAVQPEIAVPLLEALLVREDTLETLDADLLENEVQIDDARAGKDPAGTRHGPGSILYAIGDLIGDFDRKPSGDGSLRRADDDSRLLRRNALGNGFRRILCAGDQS